ncbi:hypothetical protein C8A01DRAFT_38497 [Parachaetomium inaequale]|uniref:Uncharacterized protein n=1 Tax=Parachaetomium inaequale TaxID=2588326 RepID=A0AAN6PCN6_9PEZI|nr:hypothetical protein C8A01DRAFT_38497 [Parachaetomium inaequale]
MAAIRKCVTALRLGIPLIQPQRPQPSPSGASLHDPGLDTGKQVPSASPTTRDAQTQTKGRNDQEWFEERHVRQVRGLHHEVLEIREGPGGKHAVVIVENSPFRGISPLIEAADDDDDDSPILGDKLLPVPEVAAAVAPDRTKETHLPPRITTPLDQAFKKAVDDAAEGSKMAYPKSPYRSSNKTNLSASRPTPRVPKSPFDSDAFRPSSNSGTQLLPPATTKTTGDNSNTGSDYTLAGFFLYGAMVPPFVGFEPSSSATTEEETLSKPARQGGQEGGQSNTDNEHLKSTPHPPFLPSQPRSYPPTTSSNLLNRPINRSSSSPFTHRQPPGRESHPHPYPYPSTYPPSNNPTSTHTHTRTRTRTRSPVANRRSTSSRSTSTPDPAQRRALHMDSAGSSRNPSPSPSPSPSAGQTPTQTPPSPSPFTTAPTRRGV